LAKLPSKRAAKDSASGDVCTPEERGVSKKRFLFFKRTGKMLY